MSTQSDPFWFKDAIFYELRVGAFQDSDGDGVGDFRGLAERLDYLQDLGVTTLWLLPFYPSPFRDDGYDIADFTSIYPDYGTLEDFKHFLREAHRRDLRVVTELVINHTSDQHPWFQRARRSPPGSRNRDFYVWSDTPEKYTEARIIFRDFEPSNWSWDPVAKAYYWHRFFSHQPDLNFDNPDVHKAVFKTLDFWFDLGVDGLRLDAIPYLYEREGTNCENLPETHGFLADLRRRVDRKYDDRMLLAEANQWPEDAVIYFGKGDECHMAFHFPIMPRLFMALHMEDRYPIIDIIQQTPDIPENCQWALFLRNHDELTLEMVTDEERDYMYRVYAHDARARINLGIRRRLGPLLGNDRRRMELMNALLFSLPGTPVIYYGDEIGMGDNFYLGDRNGVRTPMQWSGDRNAGFSRANPQRLYLPVIVDPEYHYESRNVETQQNNRHSLLHWMKRLIALRKRHVSFGRGSIEFLAPSNRRVIAFIRRHQDETLLVVANLSRFVDYVELDLSAYKGMIAVELFSGHPFPPIGDLPYLLTLGPHAFYWFSLQSPEQKGETKPVTVELKPPSLTVRGSWETVLTGKAKESFERTLPQTLRSKRWFGGKAQPIRRATIVDCFEIPIDHTEAFLTLVEIETPSGQNDLYAVPLAFATGERADALRSAPHALFAELETNDKNGKASGVLYDATEEPSFSEAMLTAIAKRRRLRGELGELVATPSRAFAQLRGSPNDTLTPTVLRGEQSNTSIALGDRLIFKVVRRLAEGVNPELEMGRFLTERARFPHIAPLAGSIEYQLHRQPPFTVGILQGYVAHEGDAWQYTLDQLGTYFERVLALSAEGVKVEVPEGGLMDLIEQEPPALLSETVGAYTETARLLGQRTAELHRALATETDDPDFVPEPFTSLYQRSLDQSMRNLTGRVFRALRERWRDLPEPVSAEAKDVLEAEPRVLDAFKKLRERRIHAKRIRTHGDFHLGQVLHTGKDFVIVDFEGEPARSPAERRLKRSAFTDVAGMIRSFDYAAHAKLIGTGGPGPIRPEDVPTLEPWARFWRRWISSAFLRSYLSHSEGSVFVPKAREELGTLLAVLLLEKSIYELGYELNNRPNWVTIPLRGIRRLLAELATRK